MDKLPRDLLEFFMALYWLLWHRRNGVVQGGFLQDPGSLVERARSLLVEFSDARSQLVSPTFPASIGPPRQWQPPVGSWYKLNFDAAIFNDVSATGVGVVIRNGNGQVMAALSSKGPAVMDSEEVEILACRQKLWNSRLMLGSLTWSWKVTVQM